MRVPDHLQHKPIVGVNNYEKIDGMHANKSDAKALSIGKSQWNENEISAKVWRHTTGNENGMWSRQSEELPLHRVLDLAILIVASYVTGNEASNSITTLNEVVVNENEIEMLQEFLRTNEQYMKPRFNELKKLLNEI